MEGLTNRQWGRGGGEQRKNKYKQRKRRGWGGVGREKIGGTERGGGGKKDRKSVV